MVYSRPYNFPTPFTVTANKTLADDDAFSLQYCTNASAIAITVPADATFNLPVWTTIEVQRDGAGTVTFTAAAGVVIRRLGSTATTGHQIVGQYTTCYLRKIAANEWRIFGAIA
jgi:hypothetical protein